MGMFFNQQQNPIGESSQVEQQNAIPFYQSSQELGKLMLETRDSNLEAYYSLLGLVEENGTLVKINEPLMNKKGAGHLLLLMHQLNNKDVFLTKIEDLDVVITIHRLWKNIIKLLIKNEHEWDLPNDRARWSIIREIIITPIMFALRRGEKGLEKEYFKSTHESKTLVNQNSQQNFKRGFFG